MNKLTEVTPKMLVAVELLTCALRMYFDGAYFAALHLAGAAEEILGSYVSRTGVQNAFENLRDGAVRMSEHLSDGTYSSEPKVISNLMNYARNRTKHHDKSGDDEILFDPRKQSSEILERAMTNYYQLMSHVLLPETEIMRRFNGQNM